MTTEKAIKIIKNTPLYRYENERVCESHSELYNALHIAIKVLERNVPKKILYAKQDYGTPWFCPKCEADQVKIEFFCEDGSQPKEKHSYCWKCGQKIDWNKKMISSFNEFLENELEKDE